MSTPWLSLIGIGEDGGLSPAARHILESTAIVYGSQRHFELAGPLTAEVRTWPNPFVSVYDDLKAMAGTPVAILATGDPQWFGIGSALAKHFAAEDMRVLPSPSAFQLAAARMRWPLQDVECISLHGRPVETLSAFLYPGARILALTSNGETPSQVARILREKGFAPTEMTVLEHMGGHAERVVSGQAADWSETVADFNTLALDLRAEDGAAVHARTPGLPDDAFRHDGKMTKREIRAVTLSSLMPLPGQLLWDIGAGCGSIGIEWMRAARGALAVGLEPHDERRAMAAENALSLGVPGFDLKNANAPEALADLPSPDAIFIGGGLTAEGIVEHCIGALKPGGRLVANAVTLVSEAELLDAHKRFGGDLTRLSVQRASAVGGLTGWRPLMPVTQWTFRKGAA
ncbi:precorrin-6y C5,15-methyltransferase (decarboxylating) subunit CbiE [Roseibium sp.]|uniref:precorrin-6y C5,15-methyltransferase (decarboxylating) subunit CbiE n=1 Tax=Roseibium sp. TaxID=1936156 RepID=UPI003A96B0C7